MTAIPQSSRLPLAGLAALTLGALLTRAPSWVPFAAYWPLLLLTGVALLTGWVVVLRHHRTGSIGLVTRWAGRSRKNNGVASVWQIFRVASGFALRRKAHILKPSLKKRPYIARWHVPLTELGTPVARVGHQTVHAAHDGHALYTGAPRTGKTGALCCVILDAPGAVVATSTSSDIVTHTAKRRQRTGPTYIFNPSGVDNLPSTVGWDPLSGCEDPAVSLYRAQDLLIPHNAPAKDGAFWANAAQRAFAPMLHAAALCGAETWDIRMWLASLDSAAPHVAKVLNRSPEPLLAMNFEHFVRMEHGRDSVIATILPALDWLADKGAAAAARSGGLDVARLLDEGGTLYMLGGHDALTAPLISALTSHIAREARRLAGLAPGNRLTTPLKAVLDEAARICPVPLDLWTADVGKYLISIFIGVQSRAQLIQRYGEHGAEAILSNCATLVVLGGGRAVNDLESWSKLTGHRYEGTQQVPVLSASHIQQLPAEHAVIIHRGLPPMVGRLEMVWNRRDWGWLRRTPKPAVVTAPSTAEQPPVAPKLRVIKPESDTEVA